MQKLLLVGFALLLLAPNFVHRDINTIAPYNQKEKFTASLQRLNSIAQLEQYIDSIAAANHIQSSSFAYVELTEKIIEERFYHGFSHYSLNENWIAALAGRLIKEDYACKVDPESMMLHANAACSQQAIVVLEILRRKNISYRSLGFPHHYAMEVFAENEWYFMDANMEPVISKAQRLSGSWQYKGDIVKRYYDTAVHSNLNYQFGENYIAHVGAVNEIPASNARLFHSVTALLSRLAWLLPLLYLLLQALFQYRRLKISLPVQQPSFSLSV